MATENVRDARDQQKVLALTEIAKALNAILEEVKKLNAGR